MRVRTEVEPHTEVGTVFHDVVADIKSVLTISTVVNVGRVVVVRYEYTNTTVNHGVTSDFDVVESRGLDTHVIVVNRACTVWNVGRRLVVDQQTVGDFEVTVVCVVTTTCSNRF